MTRAGKSTSPVAVLVLMTLMASLRGVPAAAADLVLSEFMALNVTTRADEDGDFSDWIEVYNAGAAAANLDGYFLTDDPKAPAKWRFPAVSVPAGGFLLVFASDKDRRRAGSPLHANFRLESEGGYLALVAPGGATPVWEYISYPPQVEDYSYGLEQNASLVNLVASRVPARTLVPADGALALTWTQTSFTDTGWTAGTTGVGYDREPTYLPLIGTDLRASMDGGNTSAYIRVPFNVADPAAFTALRLRMKYDDGFHAYLNGSKVASRNAPEPPAWNSRATGQNDDADAVIFEEIDLGSPGGRLRAGANVLAIHGLNVQNTSSDFLVLPELDGIDSGTLDRTARLYFPDPSPGFGNLPGHPAISEKPRFSRPGGVFTGTTSVGLSAAPAGSTIRYTLDGSEPTAASAAYAAPIALSTSARVRARTFTPGLGPSPIAGEAFVALAADVQGFTSDIPIIILDSFGAGAIPANSYQFAYLAVFEPGAGGRTTLRDPPSLSSRAGMKRRGSSTEGQAKPNLALETWDELNADRDTSPLGFPAESDWILHAPYNFDLALMRNPFIFEISNQVGRYAVRTRFVEVYLNTDGGALARADYFGVYVFMEKIKRGPQRVAVESLSASIDSEPLIAGGYMVKIDRRDPGDSGFNAGGQGMSFVYPKEENITGAQGSWIKGYIDDFVAALNSAAFADPDAGYAAYIDPDSWVDHHILNVLPMNVDALRLSAYFFKRREGRLECGPIWDFDRSMDSTDGRDNTATVWKGTGDATDFFGYPWWGRLFQDPNFWQRWKDRWQEFRRGPLSTENLHAVIDAMAAEVAESQVRNYQRWNLLGGRTFDGEVDHLKDWLAARAAWIDSQFLAPPVLSRPAGPITPGATVSITAPAGTIHYVLDGTDPRLPGGGISPDAVSYSGPITLGENTRLVARARRSATDWSGQAAATYVVATPRLVVAEIMYHPADPPSGSPFDADDFEFLELLNAGSVPLELAGARVSGGIAFTFPEGAAPIAPGERVVLVSNFEAFRTRYDPAGIRIEGQYSGRLGNNGDELSVFGPLLEPVVQFTFSELWEPLTDGEGYALVFADPEAPLSSWGEEARWTLGAAVDGTPGLDESATPSGRQVPGDANGDARLDLADAFALLLRLFVGGGAPLPCGGGAIDEGGNLLILDLNSDAKVDIADPLFLLAYLFRNGPVPALGGSCRPVAGCPDLCAL